MLATERLLDVEIKFGDLVDRIVPVELDGESRVQLSAFSGQQLPQAPAILKGEARSYSLLPPKALQERLAAAKRANAKHWNAGTGSSEQ